MKIAMIASEANPLAKTGGLADVVQALSRELVGMKQEVVIVMPYYRSIAHSKFAASLSDVGEGTITMGWRKQQADYHVYQNEGITYYLIGNGRYFDRDALYGYGDDGERFAFFSLAAVELLKKVKFKPDIIHVHDWQAGMVPLICKVGYANDPFFKKTHYVLTIHNPAFKGMLDSISLGDLYNLPEWLYEQGVVRFEDKVSTLKAGIMTVDKITTVSPTHRNELLSKEGSFGLCDVLRCREFDFCGFTNGIDYKEWDSENDPLLPAPFNSKTLQKGKEKARKELFDQFGLADNGGPLFGLVSRLTFQKGIDLVLTTMHECLKHGACLAVVGSGEAGLEQGFEKLREEFPSQVALHIGYSNERAHLVYAASDFFLMPSLFEPCGIGQLIAERYGSLPVARDTGGLHDTIVPYYPGCKDATGFLFRDYNADGLFYALGLAFEVFEDKKLLNSMKKRAMELDNSWVQSATLYLGLYKSLV